MGTSLGTSHLPFWIFSCPLLTLATTAATCPTSLQRASCRCHPVTSHLNLPQVSLTPAPGTPWLQHGTSMKIYLVPVYVQFGTTGQLSFLRLPLTRDRNQSINASSSVSWVDGSDAHFMRPIRRPVESSSSHPRRGQSKSTAMFWLFPIPWLIPLTLHPSTLKSLSK